MCGAFNVVNNSLMKSLGESLGLDNILPKPGIRVPASTIQIIIESPEGERRVLDAKWWLLLKTINGELKPDYNWKTFNSKASRLNESRLTKKPFRVSRCIVPASGFIEGQNKEYHYLEAQDQAIAFGGVFKEWRHNDDTYYSASIITLSGHPKLETIHKKSLPLMLPLNDSQTLDAWLDRSFTNTDALKDLLEPTLRVPVIATPIKKARDLSPKEDPFVIDAD